MKRTKNIIFKIVGLISLVVFGIFSAFLIMLGMLPTKYLTLFFVIFVVLYLIFLMFIFVKKIKSKLKITAVIFLSLFMVAFGIGIKYLSETIEFIDIINNKLLQKETYYVMTLKDSKITKIKELKNQKIGLYNSLNSEHALEELNTKINIEYTEYKDIVELFEDLQDKKIDAVLINDSIKNLLETDLSHMKISLKEIDKVFISIEKEDIVKVVDVTKKTFNIYVAGGDAYGSIDNVTNTDVNMLITIDPVGRRILLTSIPRDYYVNLPSFGESAYDKLTHAGYYGIEESVKAIEKLLDVDVNYYAKVNFSTIEGVIDAIGGVEVYSDYSFCVFERTDLCYKKGYNYLGGYKALTFARERYSFSDGDVQRIKNQQRVLEAIINKITNSPAIITNYSKILDSVSSNFSTNLDSKSINRLVKMQLNDMRAWSIESTNLVGLDLYTKNTYTFPGTELYVMQQDKQSVANIKNKIKQYLN